MNYKIVKTILVKELLETLRDKRTLFAMIGIPIILYPSIFLVMSQVTLIQQSKLSAKKSNIAIIGDASPELLSWIADSEQASYDEVKTEDSDSQTDIANEDNRLSELLADINVEQIPEAISDGILATINDDTGFLADQLIEYKLDAVILAEHKVNEDGTSATKYKNIYAKINYDNTVPMSGQARGRCYQLLKEFRQQQEEARLELLGVTNDDITPVTIINSDIAPPEKTAGSILGRILPMLMIMSLAVAAFYPALDLTAGEKERGTFETLLSTPVRKTEIVAGKFLAIFSLAMITASLSLASMGFTIVGQLGQIASTVGENSPFGAISISPLTIIIMLGILMPMAFFICSVMMSIALFARNFREAQHYVTPFYLGITLPAVAASMPTVELNHFNMLLPIINVALLFKELLIGNFSVEMISAVFISISGWALLSLTISVRLFQSEQLILSQEKGIPVTIKRSLIQPSEYPSQGLGLGLFAFCLLGLFYIGTYFQSRDMISGIIITEWIIVLVPVLFTLWFFKINIAKTLSLKLPRLHEPILSVIMILAANIVIMRIGIEISKYLPMPESLTKLAETMMSTDKSWSSTLTYIFAIAVSAAVCEESLFRGPVLAGLLNNKKTNPLLAVIVTALLFAIMHMSVYRLMPTFLLGVVLGYLTWRTGSIFNSMLAHCVNNAIPVLIMNDKLPVLRDWLNQFEGDSVESMTPMPMWLILAAVAVIISVVIVLESAKKTNNNLQ